MKLISMTDFVLETEQEYYKYKRLGYKDGISSKYKSLLNYANFLKRILGLGMFVPCVDEVPLEKPKGYSYYLDNKHAIPYKSTTKTCEQYQQAQEKVLIYGCEYDQEAEVIWVNGCPLSNDEGLSRLTIEDLLGIITNDVNLTDNAIKQLEL